MMSSLLYHDPEADRQPGFAVSRWLLVAALAFYVGYLVPHAQPTVQVQTDVQAEQADAPAAQTNLPQLKDWHGNVYRSRPAG